MSRENWELEKGTGISKLEFLNKEGRTIWKILFLKNESGITKLEHPNWNSQITKRKGIRNPQTRI